MNRYLIIERVEAYSIETIYLLDNSIDNSNGDFTFVPADNLNEATFFKSQDNAEKVLSAIMDSSIMVKTDYEGSSDQFEIIDVEIKDEESI